MNVDLLIEGGMVFTTFHKRFEQKNIAVKGDRFYYLSADTSQSFEAKETIDATGQYIIPGFIDIHMHIESSMLPPATFSDAVLPFGVTTIVADSHEIANVSGMEGIKYFLEQETDLDIFYAIPSSVPSTTPEKETTGGLIGVVEVEELLDHPNVIALGEAMNFKGITEDGPSLIKDILEAVQHKRPFLPLEGHIPMVSGETLAKYMYVGLTADHTHQTPESILEKTANGMFIELQKKSITEENIRVINEYNLYEHIAIITDDVMADDLRFGHLDANVRLAIQKGMPVEEAIYTSTYTPARRMNFQDRGMIAPGFLADFIILDDVDSLTIHSVYKKGKRVNPSKQSVVPKAPEALYQSLHFVPLTIEDLKLPAPANHEAVRCNVMQINPVTTFTKHIQAIVPVTNGSLALEETPYALAVVLERYGKNGNRGYGLVQGAFTKKGAIATTWAHDHHNLMLVGTSIDDLLLAQNAILEDKGGYVVVEDGVITGRCPLPIGGILSLESASVLGEQLAGVRSAMQSLGYTHANEIMSFSTLSLPVSPQIKLTDFGMMDVHTHEQIPVIVGDQ